MGCANTSADEVLLFFDDMQSDIYCPFLSPAFIRRLYLKLGHKWLGKGSSTLVTGPKNAQLLISVQVILKVSMLQSINY